MVALLAFFVSEIGNVLDKILGFYMEKRSGGLNEEGLREGRWRDGGSAVSLDSGMAAELTGDGGGGSLLLASPQKSQADVRSSATPRPDFGGDCDHKHRFVVYIRDWIKTRSSEPPPRRGRRKDRPIKQQEYRFDCSLGDSWSEVKLPIPKLMRDGFPTTGDFFADKIMWELELQGLYSFQEQIARGKFGSVVSAFSTNHERFVAVKFLIKNVKRKARKLAGNNHDPWTADIPDEITIHQALEHPNVIKMYDYHLLSGRLCIALEYCEQGNLEQLLAMKPSGLVTEPIARRYFLCMVRALEYIHGKAIVHRDIKCSNFVIDKYDTVKLCDFGSAKNCKAGVSVQTGPSGSAGYEAPEILEKKEYSPYVVDIWALGVVLYIMLTSKLPFGKERSNMLPTMQCSLVLYALNSGKKEHQKVGRDAVTCMLTREAIELLRGTLHYMTSERFSINRIMQSAWCRRTNSSAAIGNFHLVNQPYKRCSSEREDTVKHYLEI